MASASTAFFAMVNSLAASFSPRSWAGATPTGNAGSRCTQPRIVRHQRTSAPNIRICTRSGRESILGWVATIRRICVFAAHKIVPQVETRATTASILV